MTPVVGTANHSLAVAWTSKFQAATGTRVAVLPAPNGFARANWLNTGEGRIAMLQASDYFDQMDAVQGYATKAGGPSDTRVAHMNMVTPWGFVVQGDSKIKISGPSYQAEAAPNGLRWLPLPSVDKDPAAFKRYRKIMSGYIPQTTESGVKSAIGVRMDHAFQTNHVRGDEDPEFVYQLIKWLDENHESYRKDFTHAHLMTVGNLVAFLENGALQPLHEGTIRYLKDKQLWQVKFQSRQDQLVALAQKRVKAFQGALAAADKAGVKVDPGNAEWTALWQDYRARNDNAEPFGEAVLALG